MAPSALGFLRMPNSRAGAGARVVRSALAAPARSSTQRSGRIMVSSRRSAVASERAKSATSESVFCRRCQARGL
eukprot:scaffold1875_cov253-Pinguiococcus_pyrenoidosus.AAC.11